LYLVDLVVAFVVFKETGAEVELRHPQTSVLGWLSNELQKGSKPLKPGEEIEAMGCTMIEALHCMATAVLTAALQPCMICVSTESSVSPCIVLGFYV